MLLVAEHGYDYRDDLRGDGWHGAMNYAGFMRPVWYWLHGDLPEELRRCFWGFPVGMATLDGARRGRAMRAFAAGTAVGVDPALLDARSTATTAPGSRRWPAHATASSSGSGCR